MRILLNPKWLLLLNTEPLLLLALLCYGEFSIIHSLLPPASVAQWQQVGLALAGLAAASLLYLGGRWAQGRAVSTAYAVATLAAYSLFLGFYTVHSSEILPRSVPRWLVPTDILVYVWTFVMPTLVHALLVLVVRTTLPDRPHSVAANVGLAVAVPIGWNILLAMSGSLWHFQAPLLSTGLLVAGLAVSPLVFLYFMTRSVYVYLQRRPDDELGILLKGLLVIVLPVAGLVVNGLVDQGGGGGLFGNFSSPWFYSLALLNGVLLCLPAAALGPRERLALLVGRSVLLSYTGYFFLVFLPFLPLSVLAVVAIGTGFLMLAPLLLLVVHVGALADDWAALQPDYSPLVRWLALAGGVAVLPLALTASYYHDRQVLHAALAYVYSPDYAHPYTLDAAALTRTLAVVQQHKDSRRDLFMGTQQPYLSAYYNWLVLDNLTLPDSKIADLQRIFEGPAPDASRCWAPATSFAEGQNALLRRPALRQLRARSVFDAKEQAWVSWVDLEIANTFPGFTTEYSTAIALPPGCWVGSYYLDIGSRHEAGILAERKAATWVYAQIVNENTSRDPGLLTYAGPNQLALRVYPVVGQEVRRTGIQLLHKEPIILTIDGRAVQLGDSTTAPPEAALRPTPGGAVVYLSAAAKRRLPLVQRQPYYHFLLDVSAGQQAHKAAYGPRVRALLREKPLAGPARFSLVNTYSAPVPAGADWQQALADFSNAGGCYLTGAVRRVLTAAQLAPRAAYPRLVVVTDKLSDAVLPADFADLRAAYPESDQFYVLLPDGRLEPHSLRHTSEQPLYSARPDTAAAVRAWPTAAHAQAYLPDSEEAEIVLAHPDAPLAVPAGGPTRWLTGLLLHGFDQWLALHPEAAERGPGPFVQASFQAGILTPLTAYLALENDAQKAALRRKQAEVLAANANLDAQETASPRSPGSMATGVPLNTGEWLLLVLGLAFGLRQLRQRYLAASEG